VQFRIPQPGIVIENDTLLLNAPIPGAEIRYTLDGSEPDRKSTRWSAPLPCHTTEVRARLFYMGRESVTTRYLPTE
jgi:hexosaminidase